MAYLRKIGATEGIFDSGDNIISKVGSSTGLSLDGGQSGKVTVGASGGSVGFYGVTPQARPTALVQTSYALTSKTTAALTATSTATTAPTGTSPKGYTTTAQAGAIFRGVNALIVDHTNTKKNLNYVIDCLQAAGLMQ